MVIKGLGVAMVTPFDSNLNVDVQALMHLTEMQIKEGVDFLVVLGTTGESVTLKATEKRKILDTVIKTTRSRVPVVYGMAGNNTMALVEEINTFNFNGVDAILSASPGYNKPTQEGIFQHFKHVAMASPVPVIVYNVPGRTGSNMTANTSLRIAHELPNVYGIKEASGDIVQIKEIINGAPEGFTVFSGDDGLVLPVIKSGGAGVISVIGNALPKPFSDLVNAALNGNWVKAEELNALFKDIIPLLCQEGNPAGVKAILEINKECTSHVRLPLIKASDVLKAQLRKELKALQTVTD